jgi:SnoaL-like domain
LIVLMTEDHEFIDALGNRLIGRDKMARAWESFFSHFPNYQITIESTIANANVVALFGVAGGGWRIDGVESKAMWLVPAAWRALIDNDAIRQWRVWCDTAWAAGPAPSGGTSQRIHE